MFDGSDFLVFFLDDFLFFLDNLIQLFDFCLMGKWLLFKQFFLGKNLVFKLFNLIGQLITVSFGHLKIRLALGRRLFSLLKLFFEVFDLNFKFYVERYFLVKLWLNLRKFGFLFVELASKFLQFMGVFCKTSVQVFLRLLFGRNVCT